MATLTKIERNRLYRKVRAAVEEGVIIKPKKCSGCFKLTQPCSLHGHHEDYSKPLDVQWLCPKCHGWVRRRIEREPLKLLKKKKDRATWGGVPLPMLEESPFENRGLLRFDTEDGHKCLGENLEWESLLKELTYREREVVKLRYGLDDGCTYTLKEVAKIFKVSRERVRQVEVKALGRLKKILKKVLDAA